MEYAISKSRNFLNESWLKELTGGNPVTRLDFEAACKPGENFVSKVTRYFIYYKPNNGKGTEISRDHSGDEQFVTIIEKSLYPPNSIPSRVLDCVSMFQNEITAYEIILPMLSLTNLTPKCYLAELSAAPLLVLQDLKRNDFRMADSKIGLVYDECSLTLQAIAYLHSRSIYLKNTSNEWPAHYAKLRETVFNEQFQSQILGTIWENAFWTGLESLRTSENSILVRAAKYLETLSGQVITTLSQLSKSHDEFQVICHGDLWSNNLLFRYDGKKKPLEVRMIDLQAMRPASCALDILHLLCTSASAALFGVHFQTWLNVYYTRLGQELSANKIPMPFSQAALYKELKKKTIFGVILGFMMIPCATSEPSVDSDIATDNHLGGDEVRRREFTKLGKHCHFRIRQLVLDLLHCGLLDITSAD